MQDTLNRETEHGRHHGGAPTHAQDGPPSGVAGGATRPRRRRLPTAARAGIALVFVLVAAVCALVLLLIVDKVPLSLLTPRIEASIEAQLPPGYTIDIDDTLLRRSARSGELTVRLTNMTLGGPDDVPVFSVPHAVVGLDTWALFSGQVSARSIRVVQPELTLVREQGGLGLAAGLPEAGPPTDDPEWGVTSLLDAVGVLFAMLDTSSGIGDLREVGVEDARLLVRQDGEETGALSPLTLLVQREEGPQSIAFEASLGEGAIGARIRGHLSREAEGGVGIELDVENLDSQDFGPLLPPNLPFEATSAISGAASLKVGPQGEIQTVALDLKAGAGHVGAAAGEKLPIDEVTVAGEWDRKSGRLTIHPSTILAGENRGTLSGEIVVPGRGDFNYGTWPVRLQITNVRLDDPETNWPAVFPLVSVEAFYVPARNILNIGRLDIASPEAAASLVGMVGGGRETPAVRLAGSSAPVPVRALKSLWPPFMGSGAREWVVENMRDGLVSRARLAVDIGPDEIASAMRGKPLPDTAFQLDFDMEDMTFGYLGDMPPVHGADATATLTPNTFDLRLTDIAAVDVGRGEISVTGGSFHVGDLRPKPAIGEINLSLSGPTDAIGELLNYEPLELAARRGINPTDLGGTANIDIGLVMPLAKEVRFADVDVNATGSIFRFSSKELVEGRPISDGEVSFTVADSWLTVEGTAKLDGVEADISLRQPLSEGGGEGDRTITMTLDEAARERMGLALDGLLSGPVEATVTDVEASDRGASQRISVDLASARLSLPELGLDKPPGRAAKAEFRLSQHSEGVTVDDLVLTSEGLRIEGEVLLDRDGGLVRLDLPVVRLPNGTDIAVDGRTDGGTRVFKLAGKRLELGPALDDLKTAATGGGGDAAARDAAMRIEFDVARAVGRNRVEIADLIGTVALGKTGIDLVDLSGVIGAGAPVTVSYRTGNASRLAVRSGDAGAVISFAGIYSRMRGGALNLVADGQGPSGQLAGRIVVDRFAITDDPALERLVVTGEGGGDQRQGRDVVAVRRPDSSPLDLGDVRLDRMEAQFAASDGRLEVRNGVIRGSAVGATVEGVVGLRSQRLDLHGTYVPLYALNNLFQRLPVFGVLLGGKRNEGLLGITYSLTGGLESPDLTVNPLSVVTPGVFRYIFGMDNPRSFDGPERNGVRPANPMR